MLICMQTINFITHFFLKILQRNSKFVILGNLSMPNHTLNTLKKTFINRQKINSILHVLLEILQRCCKLIALDSLGMSGFVHPKWYYSIVEIFCAYLQAKNQLHSHDFLEILQRYPNLFWELWAFLVTQTPQNWSSIVSTCRSINFDVYLHAKNKLHYSVVSWDFKESCNWIDWQHFGP